jgi:hypothetical protein
VVWAMIRANAELFSNKLSVPDVRLEGAWFGNGRSTAVCIVDPGQARARTQGSRTVSTAFIIPNRIVERQSLRVNFVDGHVDVHVVRVVMDNAHPLMFRVAELIQPAKLRSSVRRFR